MMFLEAFQIVPNDGVSPLYWNPFSAVFMLLLGAYMFAGALSPYLPARFRTVLRFRDPDDVPTVGDSTVRLVLIGLTTISFGIGYFLGDFGYCLITLVVTFLFYRLVFRRSQTCEALRGRWDAARRRGDAS
jgi:hypothetical protein